MITALNIIATIMVAGCAYGVHRNRCDMPRGGHIVGAIVWTLLLAAVWF